MAHAHRIRRECPTGQAGDQGHTHSVELIFELLAEGWTETQVLESYPNITADDLKAMFAYLRAGMHQAMYLPLRRTA